MILAAIEIENYKQYGGAHRIDFPEQGMVAITGPNGAGKTTLFEAIEWCLYGPRTIALGTIPPHGGVGNTRVRLYLQDPNDERRYVVQRELRPSGTQAEVYSEDQPGQAIVQGPRDVTEYVTKQLIGLPHGAFVSTFFTRQKELTFFGDRTPTDRRVEVARLLGFQTIRDAQDEIGEERNQTRHAALSLSSRYTQDAEGRDFAAEIAGAEAALVTAQNQEVDTARKSTQSEADAEQARAALDAWRELQEQDGALGTVLERVAGEIATAESRRQAAERELVRLDQRAAERRSLVPDADQVEPRAFEVMLLDQQRGRVDQLRALQDDRDTALGRLADIDKRLRRLVDDQREAAVELSGWSWSQADGDSPDEGIARLRQAASSLDPVAARAQVELLRAAFDAAPLVTERTATLTKYQELHAQLAAQRQALLTAGVPADAIQSALEAAQQARDERVRAREELARTMKAREDALRLAKELRDRADAPLCPICSRPLDPDEAERLAGLQDAESQRLRQAESGLQLEERAAAARIADAERAETDARRRQDELSRLEARLIDGAEKVADVEDGLRRATVALDEALAAAGLAEIPTAAQLDVARAAAEHAQQIVAQLPLLDQLAVQASVATNEVAEADRGIAELGPVTYDEPAHQQARADLDRARGAVAKIEAIDMELAGRSHYQRSRDEAARELIALTERQFSLTTERKTLGFDLETLRTAQEVESAARAAGRAAREEATRARDALREAQAARDHAVAERDRLVKLAADADRKTREADELDRMYREFAEFDKYVADHVGPLLAETTERLLAQVTDGKYDRVRFDENYGIEVFDGDECFRLEGFSGGERDVVALCARLAMSELVGSSALRPPRFLVLDEVFGSLDSERRAQLLETLGSLSSSGHFQQMFIISHVDDVQLSPVMHEAWTIEERDGVSHVVRPETLVAALT
jgi:exonuclease SbcC